MPRGLPRIVLLALMGTFIALCGALPLRAQTAVPAVLEDLKLVTEDDGQAAFLLRFSPDEPQLVPLNTNPSKPALIFRNALRVGRIPQRAPHKGLVRSAEFEVAGSDLVLRFDTAQPARVTVEPAGDNAVQVKVSRVSEEEATGSRPLGSDKEQVVKASDLAPQLNIRPGDSFEMVPLKYADVSEVIGLLVEGTTIEPNNVFIRKEPGFGSPGSGNQPNYLNVQPQVQRAERPLGQSFGNGLAVDRRLNAIWVSGNAERIAKVKDQIALIDVPVDSVILETQFVELTESGAKNLGIDLNNSSGQMAVGRLETGSFLPNSISLDPRDVLPSGVLQAAIYAQVEKGEGRILSRPRIAAQSGSTAKIITGDALPILTSITLSGVNGVSQQVQYVNVGVTLQIAPRVSSDGFVTSQIYGVVSSVTGYSQGYPTISQREAETSASVRDGETFVIGGLTQENVLKRKGKVPLLGDIPLAGQLFRLERSTRSKTELYIVITPHIVRHRRFEQPVSPLPAGQDDTPRP
ncbi:secretin N-terminal domain-containing protein [Novosphingobium sp. B 225]|uniref:secretin N-terminal domain-containing protein n=1 Tax=Novosphingobium sp. B 225 TaxID=1961849 RepID=UPI000B4BF0A2|nr:secretin N-terminal domain-containing protein [Novosphingobium sp. B 225]